MGTGSRFVFVRHLRVRRIIFLHNAMACASHDEAGSADLPAAEIAASQCPVAR